MKNIKMNFALLFFSLLFVFSCSSEENFVNSNERKLEDIAIENPNKAVWVGRSSIKSRNNQTSGYGVFLNPSSKNFIIFLDPGSVCFNGVTCDGFLNILPPNKDSFTEADFVDRVNRETSLILDRSSTNNQFKDWNLIFVPYSTGDNYLGNNNSLVNVPNNGPTSQNMNGYKNMTVVLNNIKEYVDKNGGIDEIVFMGSSAGGFGVLGNTNQMATILGSTIKTTIIIDSAPIMIDSTIFTPCLYNQLNNLWSIESIIPTDTSGYLSETYDYSIQKLYEYLAKKYPNFNFGLLSYYEDSVISGFYTFGQEECRYIPSYPPLVTGDKYKEGLLDLKENYLDKLSNWKVFYKTGTSHFFFSSSTFNESIDGKTLNDWITDLRNGNATGLTE